MARFRIPHSLTVVESKGWVCVSDRENARIQCFFISDGSFAAEFAPPEFGREVFAIAYNPVEGKKINAMYLSNRMYSKHGGVI